MGAGQTFSQGLPNLAPYQPLGWSDKIVVANTAGVTVDSSSLKTTDTLYVAWAATNVGAASTNARFYIALYLDGALKNSWYVDPPFDSNRYVYFRDYSIGSLTAGTHTLRLVADTTGAVAESNENDNEYTKSFLVTAPALPNLTPYQPSTWSDKIIVATTTGATLDSSVLTTTDTLYVGWAVINIGAGTVDSRFWVKLFVDGTEKASWPVDPPIQANYYYYWKDYPLGSLSAGTHTLRLVADATASVAETNDNDNEYTKTIAVISADLPNLTPFQPSGWTDKVVVSTTSGSTIDSAAFRTTDALYVALAVINTGKVAANAAFSIQLFLDGVLKNSWSSNPPLNPNYYIYVKDFSIGSLSAGSHTIRLVADATNAIQESSESDNEYTKTITVAGVSCYALTATSNLTAGGSVSIGKSPNCSSAGAGELATSACSAAIYGVAANQPDMDPLLSGPPSTSLSLAFERLIEKAIVKGRTRVIIGLALPSQMESPEEMMDLQIRRQAVEPVQERFLQRLSAYELGTVKRLRYSPYVGLEVDESILRYLQSLPEIISIEEDIPVPPALAESTPLVGATAAWAAGYSGAGQVVAILDSGVDKTHPFLSGKVISEACYSTNGTNSISVCPGGAEESTASNSGLNCDPAVTDCEHGTHVAGIIAGKGSTFSGVAKDTNIISIKVFSEHQSQLDCGKKQAPCITAYNADIAKGLERVLELSSSLNIASLNMSLGVGKYPSSCDSMDSPITNYIALLRSRGIATVVASGNEGYTDGIAFPACISGAISVGSTDDGSRGTLVDAVSDYSNSSAVLDLLAPGNPILSSVPGGGWAYMAGTSMAAPHVAGAWAVLKSKYPAASVDQILSALVSTGKPVLDARNGLIKPRIQIDAALNTLGGTQSGQYSAGTAVTLTATPNPGFTVQGWNGCDSSSGASCTVTMNTNKAVTAVFAAIAASPPSILAANITSITSSTATANVTVNAHGSSTRIYLQWGTTTAYGYTSSSQFITGTSPVSISILISGLSPNTSYYSRAVAESAAGTSSLAISSFKTLPDTSTVPDLSVVSLKSTTMASPGGQVPIELVIKNLGFGDAGVFRAAFYLSVDNAVDTTDTYTGWTCNFDTGLKAGSTSTCAGSIGIPSNVALGTYLLGVIADNRVELAETSRLNNTRTADSGPLTIVAADGARSQVSLSVSDKGAASFSTPGTSVSTQAGYAKAETIYGAPPYGTAVFSLIQNGVIVSEAGVPASPPTRQARVFIDYRPTVAGTPPNNSAIGVSTGIAMVNQGSSDANLVFQLRDVSGNPTGSAGHGVLSAGAHTALFVNELKRAAPDFVFPTTFSGFCSLDVSSDQPLSIVALRLTRSQRGETLLTTTPVADLAAQGKSQPIYFPHLADGGGYRTLIILMNTSNSVESGRVVLFDGSGAALSVRPDGGSPSSSYSYRMNPGALFTLQTDGSPAGVNAGSVQIIPDLYNLVPTGAAIFSYSSGDVLVTESGVPATIATTHARVYVDRSKGHDTGIAVAGTGSAPSISLAAYQADGVTPAGAASAVNLSNNGHSAAFVGELVAGLPSEFVGVLDISASQPFVALTLRSFVNTRNDFLLTTFPIADLTQAAPSPIVFPQIADGGGYATQFILLSPGGKLASTIRFYDDSGKPLQLATIAQRAGESNR